jgi:hypothetical protein
LSRYRKMKTMDPKPPDGQAAALVVAADMHPERRSGHPPSATPRQPTPMPGPSRGWTTTTTNPTKPRDGAAVAPVADAGLPPERTLRIAPSPVRQPDGAAAAPVADMGLPPKRTPRVTPSLVRQPDEGGEGPGGMTSHEYLRSRHLRKGGNVRGTPLDLSSFRFLSLSL